MNRILDYQPPPPGPPSRWLCLVPVAAGLLMGATMIAAGPMIIPATIALAFAVGFVVAWSVRWRYAGTAIALVIAGTTLASFLQPWRSIDSNQFLIGVSVFVWVTVPPAFLSALVTPLRPEEVRKRGASFWNGQESESKERMS